MINTGETPIQCDQFIHTVIPLQIMDKLNAESFLQLAKNNTIVDVRSPGEYSQGHIPGAVNIPLFSDEERAEIGTLYKQKGKDLAVEHGLDFVGPKMSRFVSKCRKLKFQDHLLIHCWRGGMRSESFAWLINTSGIRCAVLEGGYKSYRNYILDAFTKPLNLLLLAGSTGSGKTEILRHLKSHGEQIIDLEALASHKGSVFGGLGQKKQPTTEQFQNNLYHELNELDGNKRIWVEDESISIGNVHIPREFWEQMTQSPFIEIELDQNIRVERLVSEYGLFPINDLRGKILKISKRLGGLETKTAIEKLTQGELAFATQSILKYYDKAYRNCIDRKDPDLGYRLNIYEFDPELIATKLITKAEEQTEKIKTL